MNTTNIKKLVIVTSLVGTMNVNAGWLDAVSAIAPAVTQTTQETTQKVTDTKQTATANADTNCIPRMSGGSVGWMDVATKLIINPLIETALEESTGVKAKMPAPITNTCEADKRLIYLKKITDGFSKNIVSINQDLLDSLEQTKDIQEYQAQIDNRNKNREEADLDGAVIDNKEILKLIETATIKDKKKYSQALGKLAIASPVKIGELVGWDREIISFAKDNLPWAIQNVGMVKDIISQLSSIVEIAPTIYALKDSPSYKGRVDTTLAKNAAKELIKDEQELIDEAQDEFDNA